MRGDFYESMAEVFTAKWRRYAACQDSSLDFLEEQQYSEAKKLCDGCPVGVECLDSAIYYDDGGLRFLTPKERNSVVMHRRRHAQSFTYDTDNA